MTDAPGGGDNGDAPPPDRPNPFAPLPLADLPPVRRKNPLDAPYEDTHGRAAGAPDPPYPPSVGAPSAVASDTAPPAVPEPPILPSTYVEKRPDEPVPGRHRPPTPIDDDDDDDDDRDAGRPRNRKMMLAAALTLVVGGGIAAMVIIGKINSERYLITCEADRVVVEQGRSFPPWGESALDGAEWKPLKIPPEAPCQPYETEDPGELAAHYLKILQDQATTLLTAREVTKIDDAEAQLKQALLIARSLKLDDARVDARNEIERLLGDVVYWRASAKLRSASDALSEAAKQFDMAATQRPRHVTDASAWAIYVRKLVDQLRAGPAGETQATFPPLPPGERPTAPPGVALPVEPGADRGSGANDPPPVDAGVPTGGVLL